MGRWRELACPPSLYHRDAKSGLSDPPPKMRVQSGVINALPAKYFSVGTTEQASAATGSTTGGHWTLSPISIHLTI